MVGRTMISRYKMRLVNIYTEENIVERHGYSHPKGTLRMKEEKNIILIL